MKHKPSIRNDEAAIQQPRDDSEFAAEYMKAAMEDGDEPKVLLLALRHIAEARGGVARIA
jgi:DNA-binding phage protein